MSRPLQGMLLGRVTAATLLLATAAAAQLAGELHGAIEDKDVARVGKLLAEGADPNGRNAAGDPALHAAVDAGSIEILKLLLKAGVSIDARDEDVQATALHVAARRENTRFIKLLLGHKADPEARDLMGRRPVDHVGRFSDAYKALVPVTDMPPPAKRKTKPTEKPELRVDGTGVKPILDLWTRARKMARAKGAAALPPVLENLRKNPDDDLLAELLLFELGSAASPALVPGMFDRNDAVRKLCSQALRARPPVYDTIRKQLLAALADYYWRLHALWLMERVAAPDEATLEALTKLLKHEDEEVRAATRHGYRTIFCAINPMPIAVCATRYAIFWAISRISKKRKN